MAAMPEAPPYEAAPAPDAVLEDAPADGDPAIGDGEAPNDDRADLHGESELELNAKSEIVVAEDSQPTETDAPDADHVGESEASSVDAAHDANDAIDVDDVEDSGAVEGNDDNNGSTLTSPPSSLNEAFSDAAPTQPAAQVAADLPQPGTAQEACITATDELPSPDSPVVAPLPSTSAPSWSPTAAVPSPDDAAVDPAANASDADANNSTVTVAANAASPPLPYPLPYIADIAMLDTGEPGEIQPNAPAPSSFSSTLHTLDPPATPADGDEGVHLAADSNGPGIDIDKMLDAISAEASQPPATVSLPTPSAPTHPLPKPPTGPARMTGRYANNSLPLGISVPSGASQKVYASAGAPGTTGSMAALSSPPSPADVFGKRGQASRAAQGQGGAASRQVNNQREKAAVDRAYQAFLTEEKIHTAEGNWDRFPEGSRMFIGNLSQERVSKRDVFEQFYRFGRLAQVSIKSAYGFVQFHSAAEAEAAMKELQGIEIRGRKIHLEVSRIQKKDKGRDRDRDGERDRTRNSKDGSPERTKTRGGREADRYDGRDQGSRRRSRDDYRPGAKDGRETSPRRDHGRDGHYERDRNSRDDYSRRYRDRSRSPNRHDSNGGSSTGNSKSYRSRRSLSPYGRSGKDSGNSGLDALKTRQGSDVPDVQFLVTQGLERDFIKWVQGAFIERGLRTDIMLLTPHTPPRDSIIQIHVLEGVIAVVDLDIGAQSTGKIPVQVFNRSSGASNVRFDGYQGLAPPIAADVVARAKSASMAQQHPPQQQHYSQGYQAATGYGQQYGAAPTTAYPSAAPVAAAAPSSAYDLASLVGQLDNSTLAQLLGALQGTQANTAPPPTAYAQSPQAAQYASIPNTAQQANLVALLGSLGAAATPAAAPPSSYAGTAAPYAAGIPAALSAATAYPSVPQGANEQAVQAIMAQFAKFRQ